MHRKVLRYSPASDGYNCIHIFLFQITMNDGSMAVHFTDLEIQPHSEVRMGPVPFQTQRNALMSRTTPYSTILLEVHKVFHNSVQAKFLPSYCHLSSHFPKQFLNSSSQNPSSGHWVAVTDFVRNSCQL